MASTTSPGLPAGFQPAFVYRNTSSDPHLDMLTVCAMLANVDIAEVRRQAAALGVDMTQPFHHLTTDGDFLAALLKKFGLIAGVWKETTGFSAIPADAALVLVDYSVDWGHGRAVLFHRMPSGSDGQAICYLMDPLASDPKLQVRGIGSLKAAWFVGVHRATQPAK